MGVRRQSGLSAAEEEEERLLRALAADSGSSPAVRMRALEVLERKRTRRAGEQAAKDEPGELAPDPMGDLDEMEAARQKRAVKGRRRAVGL